LRAREGVVLEATPITAIEQQGEALVAHTRRGRIRASAVIVAANVSTRELIAPLGAEIPTFEVLPQAVIVEPGKTGQETGRETHRGIVRHLIGHHHRRVILKGRPTGDIMITGGWLGQRDSLSGVGKADADAVAGNIAEAMAVYPALAGARVVAAVADRAESATPDLLPIIDELPGARAVKVACGWTGHGFAIAPAVSEALAQWVISGVRPAVLAPFASDRFVR
jgi:sarcosine oxidase subunit beta